jgi:hypothetical protein
VLFEGVAVVAWPFSSGEFAFAFALAGPAAGNETRSGSAAVVEHDLRPAGTAKNGSRPTDRLGLARYCMLQLVLNVEA